MSISELCTLFAHQATGPFEHWSGLLIWQSLPRVRAPGSIRFSPNFLAWRLTIHQPTRPGSDSYKRMVGQ